MGTSVSQGYFHCPNKTGGLVKKYERKEWAVHKHNSKNIFHFYQIISQRNVLREFQSTASVFFFFLNLRGSIFSVVIVAKTGWAEIEGDYRKEIIICKMPSTNY